MCCGSQWSHSAVNLIKLNSIADFERPVDKHGKSSEKVGECVLSRQAEGQTADRKRGDQTGQIQSDILGGYQQCNHHHEDHETFADERQELSAELFILRRRDAFPPKAKEHINGLQQDISNRADHEDVQGSEKKTRDRWWPGIDAHPDVEQDDKGDGLDWPSDQTHKQILQFCRFLTGPFPNSLADQEIQTFRNVKCEENVDQRCQVLPQRNVRNGAMREDCDPVQTKGQPNLRGQARRLRDWR